MTSGGTGGLARSGSRKIRVNGTGWTSAGTTIPRPAGGRSDTSRPTAHCPKKAATDKVARALRARAIVARRRTRTPTKLATKNDAEGACKSRHSIMLSGPPTPPLTHGPTHSHTHAPTHAPPPACHSRTLLASFPLSRGACITLQAPGIRVQDARVQAGNTPWSENRNAQR